MAYKGEVPWHGLGVEVKATMTPKQMLKVAGLDWTVSKQTMHLKDGTVVKDTFALCRDKDNRVLSVVGSKYKPVQNEEALDFFSRFTKAGKMEMETAGSLMDGQHIWGLARIKADFNVGKGDAVHSYLLLHQPHVFGRAMQIRFTPIRVVCWNTLSWALSERIASGESSFRMAHSIAFTTEVKEKAQAVFSVALKQVEEFKEASSYLASVKAAEATVKKYFGAILEYDPETAKKKKDGEAREPMLLPMFQAALEHAPGANLNTAKGTWWGALNAVTYVIDHEIGRGQDTALKTAWFGNKAHVKNEALKVAVEYAKAA